jgi:hypothetical protein
MSVKNIVNKASLCWASVKNSVSGFSFTNLIRKVANAISQWASAGWQALKNRISRTAPDSAATVDQAAASVLSAAPVEKARVDVEPFQGSSANGGNISPRTIPEGRLSPANARIQDRVARGDYEKISVCGNGRKKSK